MEQPTPCYTGQKVHTVPTLLVCVACVLFTVCLSAPVTEDLCQPLPTFLALVVVSPPSNLHEVQLLRSCLFCVILQLHPALC